MSPSLVQVAANAAIASSVTVTLGSPTTPGNCLVALIGDPADTTNPSGFTATLGGSADNWAQAVFDNTNAHASVAGWADPNCAGGQTSVVISTTGGVADRLFAWVFEFSGLTGTLDAHSAGNNSFASSWTSGASGATAQASEVAFGITAGGANTTGAAGLAGPSSPWVNEAQQSLAGATRTKAAICGYQILSATGAQTYAGTASPTNTNNTIVFTLEAAPPGSTATAVLATAAGTAPQPVTAVSVPAAIAAAAGAALNAAASTVSAGLAAATGTARQPAPAIAVNAAAATGAAAARGAGRAAAAGALTASDAPASALTASDAPASALTASDQRTGGPGG